MMTAVGTDFATLDAILDVYAAQLGADDGPYRNHAHRVARLCATRSSGDAEAREKMAIAAAFAVTVSRRGRPKT